MYLYIIINLWFYQYKWLKYIKRYKIKDITTIIVWAQNFKTYDYKNDGSLNK